MQDHYSNGTVQMEGTYSSLEPSVKNGFFTYYTSEGKKLSDGEYYNNKKHGTFHQYNDAGQVRVSEEFKNDLLNGKVIVYLPDGKKKITVFQNGRFVSTDWTLSEGLKEASAAVGTYMIGTPDPALKDLQSAILTAHSKLPDSLRALTASVKVSFHIDSMGKPINLKVLNSESDTLDALVIRAIRETIQWQESSVMSERIVDLTVHFPAVRVDHTISVNTVHKGDILQGTIASSRPLADSAWHRWSAPAARDTVADYFRRLYLENKVSTENQKDLIKVTFTADKNGHPSDIIALSGESKALRSLVIKGIKGYTGWKRAPAGGKAIISYYTLSVSFPSVNVLSFAHTVDAK